MAAAGGGANHKMSGRESQQSRMDTGDIIKGGSADYPLAAPENDPDATVEGLDDNETDEPCPDAQEDQQSDGNSNTSQQGSSRVSPGMRLAGIRSRKRRNAGLFAVADKMICQSADEHKAQITEWRIDRERNRWHEEDKKLQSEFIEEIRQERIDFREVWKQNLQVMQSAVSTLQTLGEMLVSQQRARSPNKRKAEDNDSQDIAPRSGTPRRACVGWLEKD